MRAIHVVHQTAANAADTAVYAIAPFMGPGERDCVISTSAGANYEASLCLSSRPDRQRLDSGDAAWMAVQLLAHVHTVCLVLDRSLSGGLRDGVYVFLS